MLTHEITMALRPFNCFVVARDELPDSKITRKTGFVINTDSAQEPGEHWVAIYLDGNRCVEYFDPFGLAPLHPDFISFISNQCSSWYYSSFTIQDFDSSKCGEYWVNYLRSRFNNIDFFTFLNSYSSNTSLNDNILFKKIKPSDGTQKQNKGTLSTKSLQRNQKNKK